MKHQNAVIAFARQPLLARRPAHEPFAALTWADRDILSAALLGDLIENAFQLGDADIFFYNSPPVIPDELLRPFRKRLQCFTLDATPALQQIGQAVKDAFAQDYRRVILVLENHPVLRPSLMGRLFEQLDFEEDCIVVGPTHDARCLFLALKSDHSAMLGGALSPASFEKPFGLLKQLCSLDTMLFLTRQTYALDSDVNIARLKRELEADAARAPGFPRRTYDVLKVLEKKYTRAKRVYWRKDRQ